MQALAPRRGRWLLVLIVLQLLLVATVGVGVGPSALWLREPTVTGTPVSPPAVLITEPSEAVTVLAVGDIGDCSSDGDEATAALVAARSGLPILTLGDTVYPSGSAQDFAGCFAPSWGPFRDRMYPTPGNHEYLTSGASAYFDYFGDRAGTPGLGYYSFDVGSWHLVALNSERDVEAGGRQLAWLRADLEANTQRCVLAYWHKPRFTAGQYRDLADGHEFWALLAGAGAEVVLNGHDHNYQRYRPMDARGEPSPGATREFVVGTGGRARYDLQPDPRREAGTADAWGILELTLRPDGYDWRFLAAAGTNYEDSGSGGCG